MVPSNSLPFTALATSRYSSQVFGGFRPVFLQNVRSVVEHVEVAIERDEVDLAVVGRREIAEEWGDLVPVDRLILGDARSQLLEIAAGDIVDHPLRREHRSVDRVGAARPVGEHFLVEVGERNRDDVDLRAGQLLEFGGAPLQRLLDCAGLRHHVHGDAVELSRLCAHRRSEREHRSCDSRRYARNLRHNQFPPGPVGAAPLGVSVRCVSSACAGAHATLLVNRLGDRQKTILAARSARQRASRRRPAPGGRAGHLIWRAELAPRPREPAWVLPAWVLSRRGAHAFRRLDFANVSKATASTMMTPMTIC